MYLKQLSNQVWWACSFLLVSPELWGNHYHIFCKTEKYTKNCPASQTFSYKNQRCQLTCRSLSLKQQSCTSDFLPVDGCSCAEGHYLDDNGICVPVAKCPCYHNEVYVKSGKSISTNNEHWWVTSGFQMKHPKLRIKQDRNTCSMMDLHRLGFLCCIFIILATFSSICTNGVLHCNSGRTRMSSQFFFFFNERVFFKTIYSILKEFVLFSYSFYSLSFSKRILQLLHCKRRSCWSAVCSNLFKSGQWWLCELFLMHLQVWKNNI